MYYRKLVAVLVLTALALSSCAFQNASTPAKPAGFIKHKSVGVAKDKSPFHYLWQGEDENIVKQARAEGKYTIYVAPVSLSYLPKDAMQDKEFKTAAENVATHFRQTLIQELNELKDGSLRATTVNQKSDALVSLELALTEVKMGDPMLYSAAAAVPIPGSSQLFDAADSPTMAFEGRYVNNSTGRVFAEFSDRKIPRARPLDLNKATSRTAPLRDISNDWSIEIARASTTRLDKEDIEGTSMVSLLPW